MVADDWLLLTVWTMGGLPTTANSTFFDVALVPRYTASGCLRWRVPFTHRPCESVWCATSCYCLTLAFLRRYVPPTRLRSSLMAWRLPVVVEFLCPAAATLMPPLDNALPCNPSTRRWTAVKACGLLSACWLPRCLRSSTQGELFAATVLQDDALALETSSLRGARSLRGAGLIRLAALPARALYSL